MEGVFAGQVPPRLLGRAHADRGGTLRRPPDETNRETEVIVIVEKVDLQRVASETRSDQLADWRLNTRYTDNAASVEAERLGDRLQKFGCRDRSLLRDIFRERRERKR